MSPVKDISPALNAPPALKVACLSIARETFDMDLAREHDRATKSFLEKSLLEHPLGHALVFYKDILTSEDHLPAVTKFLNEEQADVVLILQLTFADAGLVRTLMETRPKSIFFWSFREERTGGRLRLNSLCGINLACHALRELPIYSRQYNSKTTHTKETPPSNTGTLPPTDSANSSKYSIGFAYGAATSPESFQTFQTFLQTESIVKALQTARIGIIGERPPGFFTCEYDEDWVTKKLGTQIEKVPLASFLQTVKRNPMDVSATREKVAARLKNLDSLDPAGVTGTLNLHAHLRALISEQKINAVAVKCWGEVFETLDCAACGAMALLGEAGIPASCEADMYGTLTSLILQWLSISASDSGTGEKPFLADWVDYDIKENTAVFWHCGLAPASLASAKTPQKAVLHSNRKRPLLHEFSLKPGKVTISRLSKGNGTRKWILFHGEVLERPSSYSGTSAVVQFEQPVETLFKNLMREGLEHHTTLAYGDITTYRPAIEALAERLGFPVVEY